MDKIKFKKKETVIRNWLDSNGKPMLTAFKVDVYRLDSDTDETLNSLSGGSIIGERGFYRLEKELYGSHRVYHIIWESNCSSRLVLCDRHEDARWYKTIKEATKFLMYFLGEKHSGLPKIFKSYKWINPEEKNLSLHSWKPKT